MPKLKKPENFLSLTEVANKVGVVKRTIIRWIDDEKVKITPLRDFQNHYRFTSEQLQVLVEFKSTLRQDHRHTTKAKKRVAKRSTRKRPKN